MTKSLLLLAGLTLVFSAASAQDWAKARLDSSPRHLEWIKVLQGDRKVESFIAFPEVKDKATAVVVIHEIFGLSDWVRGVTDQFAEAGYIAIAPDLLSGRGPNGGGTADLGGADGARKEIGSLTADQVTADLNAIVEYVSKLPACNGKVVVVGFCWGGGQSFRYGTNNPSIKASFVCYGTSPTDPVEIAKIKAPVYGFYGGSDARVTATTEKTAELMKAAGKTYEKTVYEGAGHGFMRAGEDPKGTEPNKTARDSTWKRWLEILKTI